MNYCRYPFQTFWITGAVSLATAAIQLSSVITSLLINTVNRMQLNPKQYEVV